MTAYTFNAQAFTLFVSTKNRALGLPIRETSDLVGVSTAQLFRALHGQAVNNAAFLNLCIWLEVNPFAFLLDPATGRGLADLPAAPVPRESSTETRGAPRKTRAAA